MRPPLMAPPFASLHWSPRCSLVYWRLLYYVYMLISGSLILLLLLSKRKENQKTDTGLLKYSIISLIFYAGSGGVRAMSFLHRASNSNPLSALPVILFFYYLLLLPCTLVNTTLGPLCSLSPLPLSIHDEKQRTGGGGGGVNLSAPRGREEEEKRKRVGPKPKPEPNGAALPTGRGR